MNESADRADREAGIPGIPETPRTLLELLQEQAERQRDKVAFHFCPEGIEEQARLTYRELDTRARAIASRLQQHGAAGKRVLVLCRPGLDGIVGIFACIYAGAVAVPVDEHWVSARVASVVPDARAGFALGTGKSQAKLKDTVDGLVSGRPLQWFAIGEGEIDGDPEDWMLPRVDASAIALLQYTSGSTGTPKGVMLTHRNLMSNLAGIREAWTPESDNPVTGLSWMPTYQQMGLVGSVLLTLHAGHTAVLMSPGSFLIRPIRWLEAMSHHRALISVAPNFALDWCVKRSTAAERAALDLSNWAIAITGGEPVHAETLRAFADAFAPAGFRMEAFRPAYGQAEVTLGVSGVSDSPVPVVLHLDRTALAEDRAVDAAPDDAAATAIVGCGRPHSSHQVLIVDYETQRRCGTDEVGEIWISGPSVAPGYWRRSAETKRTFSGFLADTGEGPFLRTGDLGFLRSGELFVTGRTKDLIVIGDFKHYPNDIEQTVQACDPLLLPGRGAAFAVTPEGATIARLVVVQEIQRHRAGTAGGADLAGVIDTIRAAITEHHGVEARTVLLVKPMKIPTTPTGKVQRGACRQQFLDGELEAVAQWQAPPSAGDTRTPGQQVAIALARLVAPGLRRHWESRRD